MNFNVQNLIMNLVSIIFWRSDLTFDFWWPSYVTNDHYHEWCVSLNLDTLWIHFVFTNEHKKTFATTWVQFPRVCLKTKRTYKSITFATERDKCYLYLITSTTIQALNQMRHIGFKFPAVCHINWVISQKQKAERCRRTFSTKRNGTIKEIIHIGHTNFIIIILRSIAPSQKRAIDIYWYQMYSFSWTIFIFIFFLQKTNFKKSWISRLAEMLHVARWCWF